MPWKLLAIECFQQYFKDASAERLSNKHVEVVLAHDATKNLGNQILAF